MKHAAILAAEVTIGLGSHAMAQTIHGGFEFRVSNVVSPSQPTATVEVWAWFDNVPGVSEIWAGGDFDLIANEPLFVGMRCPLHANCGTNPPLINGGMISHISTGQLHFPALGFFGDPSNPLLVFEADWTTTNFTVRDVPVLTGNTTRFLVYDAAGNPTQLFPAGFSPAQGMIAVVPAPGSLVGLSGVFVIGQRQRRSMGARIAGRRRQRALTAIEKRVIMYGNRSH